MSNALPPLPAHNRDAMQIAAATLPQLALNDRQLCDIELLMSGGFAPLTSFLDAADYRGVIASMRLASGALWSMPIVLDVTRAFAATCAVGDAIALTDLEGVTLARYTITGSFEPDAETEAVAVFGTGDRTHPGVADIHARGPVCLAGILEPIAAPVHHDFAPLRHSPATLRSLLSQRKTAHVVAFQTRNPLHRAHYEMTRRAAEALDATLLLHPVVGRTKPGDIDHYTRVRCYEALLPRYAPTAVVLSLLPLAMRMGGPREALWHAQIRKNHGATHFIVGRDHAGPGLDASGRPFYPPLAAQELAIAHERELGITITPFPAMVYSKTRSVFVGSDALAPDEEVADVSGTELRRRLLAREPLPEWFTFPEVAGVLEDATRPKGLCIFLTGLSGAGKSTIAQALAAKLLERSARPVSVLDGDEIRRHLSKGLGFSREDRDTNVARIGFVASEVVRHGGIVIAAQIAPYASGRAEARRLVSQYGHFIEVYIATPLDECERRDRKGLYALARAGKLGQFTGISDPYEVPKQPDVVLDTLGTNAAGEAEIIFEAIRARL